MRKSWINLKLCFLPRYYMVFFLTLQNDFCWTSRPLCRRRKNFWLWNTSVGYPSKCIILSYGLTHSYSSIKTREDIWSMNDVLSSYRETECKFLAYYSNLNYLCIKYYSGKSWLNLDEFSLSLLWFALQFFVILPTPPKSVKDLYTALNKYYLDL